MNTKRISASLMLLVLAACGGRATQATLSPHAAPPPTTATTSIPEPTTTTPTTTAPRPVRPTTTVVVTDRVSPEPSTTTTTATVAPPDRGATSHGGPVRDHVSLVDALRARGLTVTPSGVVVQPFLQGDGTVLSVTGAGSGSTQLQSFEYESAQAAAADAATLTPECQTATMSISWIGPPHFYRAGRVLVIFVGSDPGITALLAELLGPPVCGA